MPGQDYRDPRGARRPGRDLGPVPLPRASARTPTCSRSGTPFRPWTRARDRRRRRRSSTTCGRRRAAYGIDRSIRLRPQGRAARWSHRRRRALDASRRADDGPATAGPMRFTCSFCSCARGYYDYEARLHARRFAAREHFRGTLVHPQHWPADLDYAGKRVVVIGSGATAVTLVPALAERAAHVTMLQRSPSLHPLDPRARIRIADVECRRFVPVGAPTRSSAGRTCLLGTVLLRALPALPERCARLIRPGDRQGSCRPA